MNSCASPSMSGNESNSSEVTKRPFTLVCGAPFRASALLRSRPANDPRDEAR